MFFANLLLQIPFVGVSQDIGVIDKEQVFRTWDQAWVVTAFLGAIK